ncbi:putative chromatin remodeling & transcriptional activation HMG family [Helianthus annuus]|nr:putative chromatin remodeling & transcriptional activation HMG family [Helianthus annuus]
MLINLKSHPPLSSISWRIFVRNSKSKIQMSSQCREIGKACGEKWKIMTYEEKVQYYDVATEQRAKFEKALADYAKRKENGEHDEFDEDSDSDYDE